MSVCVLIRSSMATGFTVIPLKAALVLGQQFFALAGQHLVHRTVVADEVEDEGFAQFVGDAAMCEKFPHIEKITGVLTVEGRQELPCIQVRHGHDADFGKAEGVFDGGASHCGVRARRPYRA
jgi:hypothetical protein